MALFRSERGIGRGEVAESRIEAPFFAAFMICCVALLLVAHLYFANQSITMVLAVSMVVFGITVVRVDYGVYILVIAMLLSPEIYGGYKYSGERPMNIRYGDVLIAVIFVGVMVKLSFEGRARLWRTSPVNAGIVTYYGVCCFSTLLALRANMPAWRWETAFFVMLKMAEFYMIFFLVGNAIRTREEVRRQLTLFLVVALIICGYGIMSMRTLDRVGAPFEARGTEPNTLGGYLTIVMCIAMGLYAYAPTRAKRFLFLGVAAFAFIPFLYTLSRASYIALLVAILTLGIAGRKLLILGALAAILILSPILMPEEVKDRVNYTFQRGTGVPLVIGSHEIGLEVDKSTYERVYVWRKVGFILHVAPWFGGGVSWESVMDSQYARVILETGLFGLGAFLFLQWRLWRTAREAHRWSRDWLCRGLGLGMMATVAGIIVHGFGTISFVIIRIMEPFWFLMALAVTVRTLAIEDHARRVQAARQAQAIRGAETEAAAKAPSTAGRPTPAYPTQRQAPSQG